MSQRSKNMAPAIECGCGGKWKTPDDSKATSEEMTGLFNAAAKHASDVSGDNGINMVRASISAFSNRETIPQLPIHKVIFTYHETTPTKGFEKATVV